MVPLGDSPDVGVAGLTLGGGIGWLSRKHGLTLDSLASAEVVLADGSMVTASETEHEDLFWGLRGGGGNLGVVTSMRFGLQRLGPVIGGLLVLPASPRVIRGFLEAAADAPSELGTIALVTRLAPLPAVPPESYGRLAMVITLVWCGDEDAGWRQIDRLRSLAAPLVDALRLRPYMDMFELLGDAAPATITNSTATLLTDVERFDERAVDAVLDSLESPVASAGDGFSAIELRVLGGAVAAVAPHATAYAHRDRDLVCSVVTAGFRPSQRTARRAWVRALTDRLAHADVGAYVNFVGDASQDPLAAAYPPETLRRLVETKARYDPDNIFHRNLNVPPGSAGSNQGPTSA